MKDVTTINRRYYNKQLYCFLETNNFMGFRNKKVMKFFRTKNVN